MVDLLGVDRRSEAQIRVNNENGVRSATAPMRDRSSTALVQSCSRVISMVDNSGLALEPWESPPLWLVPSIYDILAWEVIVVPPGRSVIERVFGFG
jgi:hypothetical protein